MTTKTKLNYAKLEPHPLGAIFPPMTDSAYAEFVKGMKKHGFDTKEKITLLDGMILDGNHRYTAAKKAKIALIPELFEEFKGEDPFKFVVQRNLHRRHLTPSQSAAAAANLVTEMKAIEKAHKAAQNLSEKESNAKGAKKGSDKPQAPKRPKGSKTEKAAKAVGVSPRSVAAAEALKKSDPEEFKEVQQGKKSLRGATKDAEAKKSAADRKGDAFAEACAIIDRTVEAGFTDRIKNKISSKDIIRMSGLDAEEMIRVAPFLENGWKLSLAMGFKAVSLVPTHPIRALVDRAVAQGGKFELLIPMYGEEWEINVKKRGSVQS